LSTFLNFFAAEELRNLANGEEKRIEVSCKKTFSS